VTETPSNDRTVTVGVDGSPASAFALQWAIHHADQLGAVRPVMTFVTGPFVYGFGTVDGPDGTGEPYRGEASARLDAFLQEHAPASADAGRVIESRPGPGLVRAAEGSELLVVGTRGWSNRDDFSIGSVGAYCARHSRVPVALVPPEARPVREHFEVVVGFDGSAHADHALRWTLAHVRRSARVVVVRAYPSESVTGEPLSLSPEAAEQRARTELEEGVAAIIAELGNAHDVRLQLVPGDARVVLRTASETSDLLVVGSRGRGVLDRLLLGSVANALVHHPNVPTIVVPPNP
jgi:nucleotide-binding universal stress UspA family protein